MDETKDETTRARLPRVDQRANVTYPISGKGTSTGNLQILRPQQGLLVDNDDYLCLS